MQANVQNDVIQNWLTVMINKETKSAFQIFCRLFLSVFSKKNKESVIGLIPVPS